VTDTRVKVPPEELGFGDFSKIVRKGGSKQTDELFWISRHFMRLWTPYLSWIFVKLRVSANAVTLASAIFCVTGAVLFVFSRPWAWLVGSALIFVYWTLDHCDGEVARYYQLTGRRTGERDGMFYDTLVHGIEPLLILCLAFRLYLQGGLGPWPLIVAGVDVTANGVAPQLRYYLVFVRWFEAKHKADPSFQLGAAAVPHAEALFASGSAISRTFLSRALLVVKQMLLFPGYFVTLVAAVVLDVSAGPAFHIGSAAVHWRAIWLALHAAGAALAAIHWTIVNAGRLRELKD